MKIRKKYIDPNLTFEKGHLGETINQFPSLDPEVLANSTCATPYTIQAQEDVNPLNNPTPFQNVPQELRTKGEKGDGEK